MVLSGITFLQSEEQRALGRLRKEFNLFANLRPAKIYDDLKEKSPLKNRILEKGMIKCTKQVWYTTVPGTSRFM